MSPRSLRPSMSSASPGRFSPAASSSGRSTGFVSGIAGDHFDPPKHFDEPLRARRVLQQVWTLPAASDVEVGEPLRPDRIVAVAGEDDRYAFPRRFRGLVLEAHVAPVDRCGGLLAI